MRQAYNEANFRGETLKMVYLIDNIIETYQDQGFQLSVRQIYYQLVARGLIENTERSYKRIASIINHGRLGGYLDWDAIEDRGRDIEVRPRWDSGASIVKAAASSFHMDMWENQEHRPIVIVEKAALAGVLSGVCHTLDVPLLAARGYPSVSIVREMALNHIVPAIQRGQWPIIIHLGDHDPSGIDMTRDLEDRLSLFVYSETRDVDIEIRRIALTMQQVDEKQPPPNPAKTTDARFEDYRRKFGDESWELDALEPQFLVRLVQGDIERFIDEDRWQRRKEQIEDIRSRLTEAANTFIGDEE